MAPAPGSGSGHPNDDDEIQTPTPTPTAAMSSTQDHNQFGASPTAPPWSSTYPPFPSSWEGQIQPSLTPIATATDAYGMVFIIVADPSGSIYKSSPQVSYTKEGGVRTSSYIPALADSTPTSSPFTQVTNASTKNSAAATSSSSSGTGSEFQGKPPHRGPPFQAIIAMSIVIPTIIIALSLCAFYFLCIRRKRKTSRDQEVPVMAAARRVPEMKDTGVGGGPVMPGTRVVTPVSTGSGTTSSSAMTSSAGPATPPVILSTTMNDAYYTGIDTSDHISLSDQRSEASADTFGEEPPPPYRPRSVPPISRETSVRDSMCRDTSVRSSRHDPMSGSNLMRRSVDVRSPFDDPEDSDDDNLSQISTIRSLPRRDTDRLSVVSDMSYQEEPTHAHAGA